jgi:hypothetical protein
MIFMSQTGLIDTRREADWDRWYEAHLCIMASVPGVTSAQRFRTSTPDYSPSLALYTVASAEVFTNPYYLSIRGLGEWDSLVNRRHYHRNLFDGLDIAPDVPLTHCLLIADRAAPETHAVRFVWLKAVAIDQSTPYRGIAVVAAAAANRIGPDERIAVYRPVAPALAGRKRS